MFEVRIFDGTGELPLLADRRTNEYLRRQLGLRVKWARLLANGKTG